MRGWPNCRRPVALGAAVALLSGAFTLQVLATPIAGATTTSTYACTGANQSYTVPSGAVELRSTP